MGDFLRHYLSIGPCRILALFLFRIGFVPLRKAVRLSSTKGRSFFGFFVTLFFSAPLLRRSCAARCAARCAVLVSEALIKFIIANGYDGNACATLCANHCAG